jgi:hypothetical protein
MFRAGTVNPSRPRPGATLTELLVVVSNIAVLVGLTFVLFTSGKKAADGIEADARLAVAKVGHGKPAGRAKGGVVKPATPPGVVPDEWIVKFRDTVADPVAEAQRIATAFGGTVRYNYTGILYGFALKSDTASVARLKEDPAVQGVEQALYGHLCTNPSGVRRISASTAQTRPPYKLAFPPLAGVSGGGAGGRRNIRIGPPGGGSYTPLAVAVVDSGIDSSHPDLNVVFSRGFGAANPTGEDQNGHGTHVSGTIGAKVTSATPGVFPGVPLWSIRVADASGRILSTDYLAGLDEVFRGRSNLSVVNMSIGFGASTIINDAADKLVNNGLVVVVAAGNSSQDASSASPASGSQVICVAALADSDGLPGGRGPKTSAGADDTFATFSNWGNVVDVIAPGVDITSTWSPTCPDPNTGKVGLSYNTISGTSMATPHVAGLCAIIAEDGRLQARLTQQQVGLYLPQPLPQILNPNAVRGLLFSLSTEQITGRFDSRTYPLITGRP